MSENDKQLIKDYTDMKKDLRLFKMYTEWEYPLEWQGKIDEVIGFIDEVTKDIEDGKT